MFHGLQFEERMQENVYRLDHLVTLRPRPFSLLPGNLPKFCNSLKGLLNFLHEELSFVGKLLDHTCCKNMGVEAVSEQDEMVGAD